MKIMLSLFGAFRGLQAHPVVELELPAQADVAALRAAVAEHAAAHWPDFRPALLAASVFATEQEVLREHEALPADGRLAILPPVSGG